MTTPYSVGTPEQGIKRASLWLPPAVCKAALAAVEAVAGFVVDCGVSANAVTGCSIALGLAAGVLVASGRLAPAAVALAIASLGDALDGAVARKAGAVSVGGALLDASGDRYQELFFLGGVAVLFRESLLALVVTLFAIGGSFMVSYGSAKAEALRIAVPPGAMRRAERAVCLCAGTFVASAWQGLAHASTPGAAAWMRSLPLPAAVAIVAVMANVSAVRRLLSLARAAAPSARAVRVSVRPEAPKADAPLHASHQT